jgi:hypothetical protein
LLFLNTDGSLWKWNPCATILVSINFDRAPAGALDDVTAAVDQLRLATGLPFVIGPAVTSHVPAATPDTPGVLIHWMTPQDDPSLAGNTLGWGGARGVSANGGLVLFSGEVRLKAGADYTALGGDGLLDLLLHELGHVAGLAHVDASTQVMYPSLSHLFGRYQRGDLAGLTVVGAGAGTGCGAIRTQRAPVSTAISVGDPASPMMISPMMVATEPAT